jgi:hypothetical protein
MLSNALIPISHCIVHRLINVAQATLLILMDMVHATAHLMDAEPLDILASIAGRNNKVAIFSEMFL